VAANLKTEKLKIIRVLPDLKLQEEIDKSVRIGISFTTPISVDNVHSLGKIDSGQQYESIINPWG
jgi:hypothetical protein